MEQPIFYNKEGFLGIGMGNHEYHIKQYFGIADGFAFVQGNDIFMNEQTFISYRKYLKSKMVYQPGKLFKFLQSIFN